MLLAVAVVLAAVLTHVITKSSISAMLENGSLSAGDSVGGSDRLFNNEVGDDKVRGNNNGSVIAINKDDKVVLNDTRHGLNYKKQYNPYLNDYDLVPEGKYST